MSLFTGIDRVFVPFFVFSLMDCKTLLPFSMVTIAVPSLEPGNDKMAFSPGLYLLLSVLTGINERRFFSFKSLAPSGYPE